MLIVRFSILSVILILLFFYSISTFAKSESTVLYKGDNFEFTKAELAKYRGLKIDIKPTEEALKEFALLVELENLDYNSKKISCPELASIDEDKVDEGNVKYRYYKSVCYTRNYTDNYELTDGAVESFYRANWKKFVNKGEMLPLNEELKKVIRKKIITHKLPVIRNEIRKSLMEKYNVRKCGGGKCN